MKRIVLKELLHGDRKFIKFQFTDRDHYFICKHLEKLDGVHWSKKSDFLYRERTNNDVSLIYNYLKGTGYYLDYSHLNKGVNSSKKFQKKSFLNTYKKTNTGYKKIIIPTELNEEAKHYIEKFEQWLKQKRYSKNTINTYTHMLSIFFRFYSNKCICDISVKDIDRFNYEYIIKNGYSFSFQNQMISAIKRFYLKMLGIKVEFESLERPRKSRPLPKVIAQNDIKKILESIPNLKHKTALSIIYSLGLRRSELINMQLNDISTGRNTVTINNSKGNKDRVLPIPETLMELIKRYYNLYTPETWLIEGTKAGTQYSASSLQKIFEKYSTRIIGKNQYTLHCLRHSYATHLHEAGVDIRIIQELLGHKSSKTTEIYTHVSIKSLRNINNPINNIEL